MHAFRTFVCKINGLPFEIVLDTSLDVPTAGFDWHKVHELHAAGQSVRAIAGKLGVSKSLVANILAAQPGALD